MTKTLLLSVLAVFLIFQCSGTANFVVHEHTMNNVGGACGIFVDNLNPTSADAVTLEFAIDMPPLQTVPGYILPSMAVHPRVIMVLGPEPHRFLLPFIFVPTQISMATW